MRNSDNVAQFGPSRVSLRLGHARVLTPHRGVIHSPHAASLRQSLQFFSKILHSAKKCAIINPERRWIYEGTEDNKSDTVRLDIRNESFSCGLPLAVRTERKYYARYLTYRTLPSESVVLAIMADYPLLAAHATEATDLPKDHL